MTIADGIHPPLDKLKRYSLRLFFFLKCYPILRILRYEFRHNRLTCLNNGNTWVSFILITLGQNGQKIGNYAIKKSTIGRHYLELINVWITYLIYDIRVPRSYYLISFMKQMWKLYEISILWLCCKRFSAGKHLIMTSIYQGLLTEAHSANGCTDLT